MSGINFSNDWKGFLAGTCLKTQYADVKSTEINSFCGMHKDEPTIRTVDQSARDLRQIRPHVLQVLEKSKSKKHSE